MSITTAIAVNAVLFALLIGALLLLLGHSGVRKTVEHEKSMLRFHRQRRQSAAGRHGA